MQSINSRSKSVSSCILRHTQPSKYICTPKYTRQIYNGSLDNVKPYTTDTPTAFQSSDISFDDPRDAFAGKSIGELVRAFTILGICRVRPLVSNANKIIDISRRVIGDLPVNAALKYTFYKHFCGGEQSNDLTTLISHLQKQGVGATLDYAAERDVSVGSGLNELEIEHELERNCVNTMNAIKLASNQPRGFTALKLTSIINPKLIVRISNLIESAHTFYSLCVNETLDENDSNLYRLPPPDRLHLQTLNKSQFIYTCKKTYAGPEDQEPDWGEIYMDILRYEPNPLNPIFTYNKEISYHQWMLYFSPDRIGQGPVLSKLNLNPSGIFTPLSANELSLWHAGISRFNRICSLCSDLHTHIFIDAEQNCTISAVDWIVCKAQCLYNKHTPVVYNTYQCYLKDSYPRLYTDIHRAKQFGIYTGIKLVRGAYSRYEREIAKATGIPDPIHKSLLDTHVNFNNSVDLLLDNYHTCGTLLGTHNEESCKLAISGINSRKLTEGSYFFAFGQLLGMCDHITYTLAKKGFSAFKYVPYGPLQEVLPYLLRRAEENADMLGSASKESRMLLQAFQSRLSFR